MTVAKHFAYIQGVADEGTPPRDLGDTYSQSTDPSDEEQEGGVDDFEAAGPSKHAVSSQQAPKERTSGAAEQGHHSERIPGPSAQPAHQRGSLQQEPSGTLDTQHDPAEDANMQEGETSAKSAHLSGCMCRTRLLQRGCSSKSLVIAALTMHTHGYLPLITCRRPHGCGHSPHSCRGPGSRYNSQQK